MAVHDRQEHLNVNWIFVLSYAGSLFICLAVWTALFHAIRHFAR